MSMSYYRPGKREKELLAELEVLRRDRVPTWPSDFAERTGYTLKVPQQYKQLRWEIFRYAQESAPDKVKGQQPPERPNLPPVHDPLVEELETRAKRLEAENKKLAVALDRLRADHRAVERIVEDLRAVNIELLRRTEPTEVGRTERELLAWARRVLKDPPPDQSTGIIDLVAERERRS